LRPAIKPFLNAVTKRDMRHFYYNARSPVHSYPFLIIYNGEKATSLTSYSDLDFNVAMRKLNDTTIGQRWNSQFTWGFSSLNIRRTDPNDKDKTTRPSIKKANVSDGILPQFVVLSKLLLEVDKEKQFYCGLVSGDKRRQECARLLMDDDPKFSRIECDQNVLESVSGLSNIYLKNSNDDMFARAWESDVVLDHDSKKTTFVTYKGTKRDHMKTMFWLWGIPEKYVIVFPHLDFFNSRAQGQNFLGVVSRTVCLDQNSLDGKTYEMKQRQAFAFCQRKANEDTLIRQKCTEVIREKVSNWRRGNWYSENVDTRVLTMRRLALKSQKEWTVNRDQADPWKYNDDVQANWRKMKHGDYCICVTNRNKCAYYSLFCSDMKEITSKFKLSIYRQIECLSCLLHTNGPEKIHMFFLHLLTLHEFDFPKELIPCVFIDYCHTHYGHVYSWKDVERHGEHWKKPYLKAELVYGLRVLLSIITETNTGSLSKVDADKRARKEIRLCCGAKMNEIFAVAVLLGLIVPRDFLLLPIIPGTLCQEVRKRLFDDDSDMSNERIRKCAEKAAECMNLHLMSVEHALTDMVLGPRSDMIVMKETITWIEEYAPLQDGVIHSLRGEDGRAFERSESTDKAMFAFINKETREDNLVHHHWWRRKPTRHSSFMQFMKDCYKSAEEHHSTTYNGYALNTNVAVVPVRLLCPSIQEHKEEKRKSEQHWRAYIKKSKNAIRLTEWPIQI